MVSYKEIQASNALINNDNAPRVCVFVGGTSGIGKLTIQALVATGARTKIYLVGRASSAERSRTFIQEQATVNPNAEIIWVEGEVSLLAESQRICNVIKANESRVDLLFLTAGYAPFGGRQDTDEGIDVVQSLEYYGRMLFILQLLPLLKQADTGARVISVLAGGRERGSVLTEDLDLRKPGNYGVVRAQTQLAEMNTAAMDRLATAHDDVTFLHSWPGLVNTGNAKRGSEPGSLVDWLKWLFLEPLIYLLACSDDVAAQRNLFLSTSALYGERGVPWGGKPGLNALGEAAAAGNGLFLTNYKCDCTPNAKAVKTLREKAQDKIWEHTQEVLRPYM